MTIRSKPFCYSVLILLFAIGAAACGDNPVDDDNDEHSEVDGLRLILNGVEVYRTLEAEVSCQQEPCGIDVAEGSETALIRVEFLDHDGDEIHDEDLDEGFSLGFEIADPAIADVEQHDEDGKWNFHIVGLQAGETKMIVKLVHGADQHDDFKTLPLTDPNALTVRVAQN